MKRSKLATLIYAACVTPSLGKFIVNANRLTLLFSLFAALFLVGCATTPQRTLSLEPATYAMLPNGHDPLNPDRLHPNGGSDSAALIEGAMPLFERLRGHALNILELSGGGQYGAFGAGFLKGWRESGTRPEFDIVSGVSTGALLSTHAFLGTPADDAVLEEIFTNVDTADIYKKRRPIGLLFGINSMFDTSPLQGLIDKHITEEVLQRVAAAHDANRRLLVGTTNLDYNQTWVWDMGLIAKQGGPQALELYKNVLLASASPPIAFPPVEIDGHLFADGSVRQNLVVIGLEGTQQPTPPRYGPGNVYVMHNGQRSTTPRAIQNDVPSIAGPVLNIMLATSMDALLLRSYFAAHARGYRFKLVSIPEDVEVGNNALAFDDEQMRTSFDAGYKLALQPNPWLEEPQVVYDIPNWALEYLRLRR